MVMVWCSVVRYDCGNGKCNGVGWYGVVLSLCGILWLGNCNGLVWYGFVQCCYWRCVVCCGMVCYGDGNSMIWSSNGVVWW